MRTAPHPSAQLMQLCEAKLSGVPYQHDRRVWNIHPDLDHRGGNQNLRDVFAEFSHGQCFLFRRQLAMQQADAPRSEGFFEGYLFRGNRPGAIPFRLVDSRENHVGLAPLRELSANEFQNTGHFLFPPRVGLD